MNALPSKPSSGGSTSQTAPSGPKVAAAVERARPGDQPAVLQFLCGTCPSWSSGRLKDSLDDPLHEPPDRLLIKAGSRIIAHAHTTRRVMQFGAIRLPVGELQWVLVAPEFRRQGLGKKLLEAAARHMSHDGSLLGLARSSAAGFFQKLGWGSVGVDHRSTIHTRRLLSEMHTQGLIPEKRRTRLSVRPWRRVEIPAVERIYNRNLPGTFGPMRRTAATWQWIVGGEACEQLYVATAGPQVLEIDEARTEVVAYAAVRRGRILELLTAPGRRAAALPLLARLGREAIERDCSEVALYASPVDQLHGLFRLAGGQTEDRQPDGGQILMALVLAPAKLLRQVGPELLRRAEAAGLELPLPWSLTLDRRSYLVTLDARGATVTAGRHPENRLRLAGHELAPLVLGQIDWHSARQSGRLIVSGERMEQAGPILFPQFPFWCPPLDSAAALM